MFYILSQILIFGDMSSSPVNDLSVILDDIVYPILSNPQNQSEWPEVVKKDVDFHVQELRNVIAEVNYFVSSILPVKNT